MEHNMDPRVDEFIKEESKWQGEFKELRRIILDCQLTEGLKWGKPCYTYQNDNVVLLHGFKEYCAILFIKGSLLKDTKGILIQQTENVQAGRQLRFTSVSEITAIEDTIKDYVHEAIEIEKAGLEVEFKKTTEYTVPEELQTKFDEMPALKTAFEALTPGRQRAYLFNFPEPKQSKTRIARIEKYIQKILDGKGLND